MSSSPTPVGDSAMSQPETRSFRLTLKRPDGEFSIDAPSDEYLLYTMQDAGIESPFICEQGWCLACAATLVEGEVDRTAALTNYAEDAAAGFVLLCSARPMTDLVLTQDIHETRRAMTQHRIAHNQLARAYPPGSRAGFRRGRALAAASASSCKSNNQERDGRHET